MRYLVILAAASLGLAAVGPARADDDCTKASGAQWLPTEQIKAKAEEMGYTVRSVGEDDGCLEVKGMDKTGARVELYFDPVTGELVKTKED